MSDTALLVLVTCPEDKADAMALGLVESRLAACVNAMPAVRSTYRWEAKVERGSETLLLIKTTEKRFDALRDKVLEMHPYELPEVIAVPVQRGHTPYLDWIQACVSDPS